MSEWIDVYDLNHQATGKIRERSTPHDEASCALVVSFWVRDRDGRLLLEQRSGEKEWFPLYWECGGGCADAGETAFEAARREAEEELGFSAPESQWRLLGELDNIETLDGVYFHHWNVTYLVQLEASAPAAKCQPEEVAEAKWFTLEELDALLAEESAPVTKYTRRLYHAYRAVLAAPMTVPGQRKKPKKEKQEG